MPELSTALVLSTHQGDDNTKKPARYAYLEVSGNCLANMTEFWVARTEKNRSLKGEPAKYTLQHSKKQLEAAGRYAFYDVDQTLDAIQKGKLPTPGAIKYFDPKDISSFSSIAVVSAFHKARPTEAIVRYKVVKPASDDHDSSCIKRAFTAVLELFKKCGAKDQETLLPSGNGPLASIPANSLNLLATATAGAIASTSRATSCAGESSLVGNTSTKLPVGGIGGDYTHTPENHDKVSNFSSLIGRSSDPSSDPASHENQPSITQMALLTLEDQSSITQRTVNPKRKACDLDQEGSDETRIAIIQRALAAAAHDLLVKPDKSHKNYNELRAQVLTPQNSHAIITVRESLLTDDLLAECRALMQADAHEDDSPLDAPPWKQGYTTPGEGAVPNEARILCLLNGSTLIAFVIYGAVIDYYKVPCCVLITDLYVSERCRQPPGFSEGPRFGACMVEAVMDIASRTDAVMVYVVISTHATRIRTWWDNHGFKRILATEFLTDEHVYNGLEGRFRKLQECVTRQAPRLPELMFGFSKLLDPKKGHVSAPPHPPHTAAAPDIPRVLYRAKSFLKP